MDAPPQPDARVLLRRSADGIDAFLDQRASRRSGS